MISLVPYLTFRDGNASLRFLIEVLGFEVVTRQEAADGGVAHAELRCGDAVIMGGTGHVDDGVDPVRGAALGLYLVVDNVDAVFERAVAAGAVVGFPPEDTEWGTRRARFNDLDGHEWSVGTYQPGQQW